LCYPEMVGVPLLAVTHEPLDLSRVAAAVADGADGATVTFLGVVRNHNAGRRVRYLEYDAYEPLALNVFGRIVDEVADRWRGVRLALHHRVGRLEIGDASVAIAAASAHRPDAFAACRYAIERGKQIAPIRKHASFG